jgi:hypothetical protein
MTITSTFSNKIIDSLKCKKLFVLAGNKEYYEQIEFNDNQFIYTFGEHGVDPEVKVIQESEALDKVRNYWILKAKVFEKRKLETDEDIYHFMMEKWYL